MQDLRLLIERREGDWNVADVVQVQPRLSSPIGCIQEVQATVSDARIPKSNQRYVLADVGFIQAGSRGGSCSFRKSCRR